MEATVYQLNFNDVNLMLDMYVTRGDELKSLAEFAMLAGKYTKTHVIQVDNADPEVVFEKTQSVGNFRSTSVGDIIVIDGKQNIVASMGFVEVNLKLPG